VAKFTADPEWFENKQMPFTLRNVTFEGSGPVVGGGATTGCTTWHKPNECSFRLYQSGFLVAEAIVSGRLRTTRQWLTVAGGDSLPPVIDTLPTDSIPTDSIPTDSIPTDSLPDEGCGGQSLNGSTPPTCDTIPAPVISLNCTPGVVTRAGHVSCTIATTPSAAFNVDSIRSHAGNFTIVGPGGQSVSAGGLYAWEGPALLSSTVSAWVTLDSAGTMVKRFVIDSFSVQARTWSELDSSWSAPMVSRHTVDPDGLVDSVPTQLASGGFKMRMGIHVAPSPRFNISDIAKAAAGPNSDLYYLAREVSFPAPPRIYTTPGFVRGAVLQDQNGGTGRYYPRCTQQQWQGPYQSEVERHEGVTRASNSHWDIHRREVHTRKWNQEFEQSVSNGSSPYVLLNDLALRYVDWYDAQVKPLQNALDTQDIQVVIPQTVGCEPDFNFKDR
jgi:hypothetical protein